MNKPDPWTCAAGEWIDYFADADFDSTWREQLQWVQAQAIAVRRAAILSGTGRDVLDAVAECARCGLVMPPWLASEFLRRHGAVTSYQAATWDDPGAFGLAHPDLGRKPKKSTLQANERRKLALPALAFLFGAGGLARGANGYKAAAARLRKSGISAKQVKSWLPKIRTDRRAGGVERDGREALADTGIKAHRPFG